MGNFSERLLSCLESGYETCRDKNELDEILDPLVKNHDHVNKVVSMIHGNVGGQGHLIRSCSSGSLNDLLSLNSGENI